MSSFVAASTSFLVYATVTSDSAQKNPAVSSVSASSMIEMSRSSSTFRILRSIGSRHGCCARSIAFNSRTVAVIGRSRVMTPPCKVFNFTSQHIAAKGRWTPRLFLGADLRCFFAPGAADSHTMKGINTWGGSYSKLLKQQLADDSGKKSTKNKIHPKFSFLFQFMFHFLLVGDFGVFFIQRPQKRTKIRNRRSFSM